MLWQAWLPGVLTAFMLILYGLVLLWWVPRVVRAELAVHTTLILDAVKRAQAERLS